MLPFYKPLLLIQTKTFILHKKLF